LEDFGAGWPTYFAHPKDSSQRWSQVRLVHRGNQAANVVADQLGEHFVLHRHIERLRTPSPNFALTMLNVLSTLLRK
jgi:hypothetical protein